MKIQLFKNQTGLIYGNDPKRISCDMGGTLKIGATDVNIRTGEDEVMPTLLHGGTGRFDATFKSESGVLYTLEPVTVRGGRIEPPPPVRLDLMELRCRAEIAEAERDAIRDRILVLEGIFDTNSLNFLIK